MISIFPYKKLIVSTTLSHADAIRKLSMAVGARRSIWSRHQIATRQFEGTVSQNQFRIYRAIRGRNSFLPVINGRFIPTKDGVNIEFWMSLHFLVLIFSIFFMSFIIFNIYTLLVGHTGENISLSKVLPLLAMLGFYYVVMIVFFEIEKRKAYDLLKDIFTNV